MFDKIKTHRFYHLTKQLQDTRNLGLLGFLVLALAISWSGIKVIQTNYELQQKIAQLQQEVTVRELDNANQKLRNQYYQTDQFLELAARRQFGLGAPGEKLVLVPKRVALAHSIELPSSKAQNPSQDSTKSTYQRNFEAWVNFFLHRQK